MISGKRFAKQLRKRGSAARKALAGSIRSARQSDRGKGDLPYNLNRGLNGAPFEDSIRKSLLQRTRADRGKIRVLDKGAGTGRMAADVKAIAAGRIRITALTLSQKKVSAKNRAKIDGIRQISGMRAKHAGRYDVIYDCYGEDYHLPKMLAKQSILKSISLLRKGGEFFTVIPLLNRRSSHSMTLDEGKALLRNLANRKNIKIKPSFLPRRFEKFEYTDMVICIKRK